MVDVDPHGSLETRHGYVHSAQPKVHVNPGYINWLINGQMQPMTKHIYIGY